MQHQLQLMQTHFLKQYRYHLMLELKIQFLEPQISSLAQSN